MDIDTLFDALLLARWVHFTSVFLLFGCSFFWFSMGAGRPAAVLAGLPWTVRKTTHLIRIAALVAAASGVAWLAAAIANMTGEFGGVVDPEILHAFFFETAFGPLAVARLILLAAVATFAILPMKPSSRFVATAAISASLLVSQAWFGHAAEGGGTLQGTAMIVAYAAHVLAGAAWVGGLPPLWIAIVEQRRRRCIPAPGAAALHLLSRYSAMAVAAVSVIVVSGIANTAFRVNGAFGTLASTTYGETLFWKLGLVALMLALAAFNRFVMMPRLHLSSEPRTSLGLLFVSIALEGLLGIFVLGFAAVLGITPPPR